MTQQLVSANVTKTAAMQLIEHRIGEDLGEFFRRRYHTDRRSMREIADELDVDVGSVQRWMTRLGIPRRPVGYTREAA